MKTFLKIVLLLIAAVVAVKLLPLIFALGCMLAAAAFGLIALGGSAIVALASALIALTVFLAPVWVTVLAIIGLIALIKRGTRSSRVAGT